MNSAGLPVKRTRAGRIFYVTSIATALGVGALQMFRVRGGLLTDYGADVFGTAWFYAVIRQGRTVLLSGRILSPAVAAAIVLAGCTIFEFGQKTKVIPGTFDWFDLIAYVLTVLICYLFDRRVASLA